MRRRRSKRHGLGQQYGIEHLSEGAVLWGVVAVALSAAVLVTLLVAAWLRERGPRLGAVGVVAGRSGLMALFEAFTEVRARKPTSLSRWWVPACGYRPAK